MPKAESALPGHGPVTKPAGAARRAYCIAGLPIHDISMDETIDMVRGAAADRTPLFLSTPNLNFLITALRSRDFRQTVLDSDLCIPDGQPLIWIARLLQIPLRHRVAGSDLLATLARDKESGIGDRPLRLLFFGGDDGIGERAAARINAGAGGLECVGAINPGFGTVEDMSAGPIIEKVNAPDADFLVAALGAEKGQLWLHRNRGRINTPVIAHLGAAMNFIVGNVRRAPHWMRRMQIEWIWRVLQEPRLFRRYGSDGLNFLRIMATRILPHAIWLRTRREWPTPVVSEAGSNARDKPAFVLRGWFSAGGVEHVRRLLADALDRNVDIELDLSGIAGFDPEFAAELIRLGRILAANGRQLRITGCPPPIRRLFIWNFCDDLLE